MKFLILVSDRDPWPMDMAMPMLQGLKAWGENWLKSGKFEYLWVNTGGKGGGAIANVNSSEELHTIMSTYPAYGTDAIKVTPISDFAQSIDINIRAFQEMMSKMH
jgi:muconolactone delta-isomerase